MSNSNTSNLEPDDVREPGTLEEYGDDETVTDRVRTNLGRELQNDRLPHLTINTQADGVVYLRGTVHSQDERSRIEQITRDTEGVKQVVNELETQG